MKRRKAGPLEIIELPAGQKNAPAILCMHGYGADGADLAPLAQEIPLAHPAGWIFPEAPHPISSFFPGRMWFPIDESRLQRLQQGGPPLELSDIRPQGIDEAREAVLGLIKDLGVPWSKLILGGFSQGSMLAVELALKAPERPRGLFILSGNLVDEESLKRLAASKAGTPFFQSHGTMDAILSYGGAEKLYRALQAAGWDGQFIRFEGGHTISPQVLSALSQFLNTHL